MTQVPADYLSTTSSYNYDQPLPSAGRTSTVTQVPPAKKITFFKSGDPQFGGVKMAINQRSFKSFNALMDDLSHRVPLPFGVRTITTPRGIHCISELDQLEDGGCYLCSDKKYVKPINIASAGHRPGPPRNGRPSSTLRRAAQEGRLDDYSTSFTQHGPRIPKKITLVKNGETSFRRSIILNRRNARSFKTLLDEISEILQFPVKKLFTVDGKKIDSMQALLHCPNVLVCVGREPFKPVSMENLRKHSVEKLPDLAPRSNGNNVNENNEMNFGLKAKKSIIHPRSASSNRSMRFSLSSEKSYPNGLAASPDNGAPFPNNCSHPKPGDLVHSLVNDDIEKRVHVNKDGSLSVEMKVRFRLLNDETLQWSTQIKKSNLMNRMPCEESGLEEDSGVDPIQKMNPEASSEADDSLYPCDVDSYMSKLEESECDEAHCHSCGKKHQDYDIWKNPMHTSQREEPSVRSTWHTRSSCSSTSSRRRVIHKKKASVDSLRTTSSEEFSEHIVQESSSYSETIENRVAYRSIKKCTCRSDLSTGASNGEDQQEYTRTSTSNSQRPSSLGLMSHSSCENNLDTQEAPEDYEASKTSSQKEDENCFEISSVKCLKDDAEEVESSRVGSVVSRSSVQSRQSKNICEETSSVGRTMSSSSLQKANEGDNTVCSTPANSVHSRSSNCSTPRAKSEHDDHSENNAVVSSFSSESCPKKEAEEIEEEENEINEISSVSTKTKPNQSVKDESSEGEQCSAPGTPQSIASVRNSRRSDSDEIVPCNASCSSRVSKKSKHSHLHLDAQSEMSVSSLESTQNKKKNSLHADDLRSCSRASNYSKSSCEIKKKSIGDPMSHNSGSFQSNISSTSEAEAIAVITEEKSSKSTTNGYSASSKGSKRGSHREENSKPSSLCSSVSGPNRKGGEGHSKMNSEVHSSRRGSISESVCSKGDHLTETGIRNGNPESVSSRVSSKSEVEDKHLLTQVSQESDGRCSQSNISQSSKSRQIKSRNLHVAMSNSSRASPSETMSICSKHCPAPPKGKPSSRKPRSAILKNSSISSIGTESVFTTGRQQKEVVDSSKPTSFGSKSVVTEANDQKNTKLNSSCEEKVEEVSEDTGAQEEWSNLIPSSLPNTSPEEVVQEWLSKIPSETLLMKYEMEDNAEEECIEATPEMSCCTNAEEIPEDEKAEKKNAEEAENETVDEVEKETVEVIAVNEEAEEYANQEQIPEVLSEAAKADQAECSQSVTSSQNNNKKDLPTSVQTSVQIMKALLSSKHEAKFDRSNSLPEVSPTMGRKLSNSATVLITCLASLQLLDEESEDPSDKSKCLNKPRYVELLNIFQALWFGQAAEKSGPSSGQEASGQEKSAPGFKVPKSVNGDFTPMSSSGVDVSSGSGGSGEEIAAGSKDCNLLAQKTVEFKSDGQVEDGETATELTEAEEQSKQEERSSRPSTACSKSKGEEKANSAREESLIQDQCSNCENDQVEGEENENTENSRLVENGEQEEDEAVNEALLKENLEEVTEQLSTTIETNVSDADCGTELKSDIQEQLEKGSTKDPEPKVDMATNVGTSLVQQNSVDPDPVWVLRLLKKIEKEFMAHYVNAMNELKVRWNLQNNQQMDEMILELKEEVSKRIQRSIEKELKKIKSRAGAKMPRPPDGPLKRESTLQTEQRRRRLQTMHKKSFFSDNTGTHSRLADTSDLSLDIDEDTAFSTAFEASISEQPSEEEYCPCDTCVRKKMSSKPIKNPVMATNAPVVKAFDLQQILKRKKDENEEACVSEAAQDSKATPSNVEETAENTNPDEENDESDHQSGQKEVKENEEKKSVLDEMDRSVPKEDAEGPILESQNCAIEEEVTDEETKEEEKEETKEVEEEEEEKVKDISLKAQEEEETKEEVEGETNEKDDKEVKEEAEEETKEEQETKEEKEEEEEGKEEEEETKEEEEEEEEEIKDEKEEGKEEEEETKEEDEVKEEEEEVNEEEETKEKEDEVKEEEEEVNEEEETKEKEDEVKEEEEEVNEEEETKEEEDEVKEEEEEVNEEEETKEEEGKGKEEEEEENEEEETKEEEGEGKEEEEEVNEEEETKEEEGEGKEEEEEVNEEEETKEEEGEGKEEEEEVNEEEETKEEEGEGKEEEDEVNEEEETKEEEGKGKEEEEEVNEEEETKEEEGEGKEEEETKEETEGREEEEEKAKEEEEEEETKEEEEDMEKEEEEAKEEEVNKEEEEGKEEEEDVKEEEEETKEDEEMQDEEKATKKDEEAKEDEEVEREEEEEAEEGEEGVKEKEKDEEEAEEENTKEEGEEAKEENEGEKDEEETKKEEEVANGEEEEKEVQNEEQEIEVESKAENEVDDEVEEKQEPEDEDVEADEEEETFKCKDVDGSEADENPEGDAVEGSEEAKQDEDEAAEDGNVELEDEACSNEEENNSEGGEKYEENDEEPTSDDPDLANKSQEGNSKSSERASKAKGKRNRKRLETLKKAVTIFGSSSLGNFSQQSQKGSDEESEEECQDNNSISEHPSGEAQSDESSKPSKMYPDSEEEEEDKASSCIDPLGDEEQPDTEGADQKEDKHKVQASKNKEGSDEIDQDDLDF